MKDLQYKDFSLKTHRKNWAKQRPNLCRFELTFKCAFECTHCYTSCYNKPNFLKNELKLDEIKHILDKLYQAGVLWLCFTGGDPLTRCNFLDIYAYAKKKGFIITIFTNGYSMSKEIIEYFEKEPPFTTEITLNAADKELYEEISHLKDSFDKTIWAIRTLREKNIPLKVKTLVTSENIKELPQIKAFIEDLGFEFSPDFNVHPRLNSDRTPCDLRVSHQEKLQLGIVPKTQCLQQFHQRNENLFHCAIGDGDIHLDPYGNMFLCSLIREPAFSLLKYEVEPALDSLMPLVRARKFTGNSKCKHCEQKGFCGWCPGRALLELGNEEEPIPYYCQMKSAMQEVVSVR